MIYYNGLLYNWSFLIGSGTKRRIMCDTASYCTFIRPLYTVIAAYAPMCTHYTPYTPYIHPKTPPNTPCTPYVRPIYHCRYERKNPAGPAGTWIHHITLHTRYRPFMQPLCNLCTPLYTLNAPSFTLFTPMYTRYTCIYTIYTPNAPLNTPYTPHIHPKRPKYPLSTW